DVLGVGHGLAAHPLDDLQTEALETTVLGGVVGEEPHGCDAQVDEDVGADAVLPAVDREAQLEVGVDGVEALLLEAVGPQLVADADATAFMAPEVHDDTEAGGVDLAQGGLQLRAAVAAQ